MKVGNGERVTEKKLMGDKMKSEMIKKEKK